MSNYRHMSGDGTPQSAYKSASRSDCAQQAHVAARKKSAQSEYAFGSGHIWDGGRYTSIIPIGLDYIPSIFGVKHKFIGNNGENLVYIAQGTGADIEIISDKPLKVQISHDDADELIVAKKLVQSLIDEVRSQFRHFPQPGEEDSGKSYEEIDRDVDMRQYDPMYPTESVESPKRNAPSRDRPPRRDAPEHAPPRRRRSVSPPRRPERKSRWTEHEHESSSSRAHSRDNRNAPRSRQSDYPQSRREPPSKNRIEPHGMNRRPSDHCRKFYYDQVTSKCVEELQAEYDQCVDMSKRGAPDRRQHINPRPQTRTYCKVCDMMTHDMEGHLRERQHDEMYLSLQLKLGPTNFMEFYGREVPIMSMDTQGGWRFATSAVQHLYGDLLPDDPNESHNYQRLVLLIGEIKGYKCEACNTLQKHLPDFIKHIISEDHMKECFKRCSEYERDGFLPFEKAVWPSPRLLDTFGNMSQGNSMKNRVVPGGAVMKRHGGNDMGRDGWSEPPPVKRMAYPRDHSDKFTCPVGTCQMGCRDPEALAHHWLELHTRVCTHYYCPQKGCGSFTSIDLKKHLMKQHSHVFKNMEDVREYLEQNPIISRRVKQAQYIDPGMVKIPDAVRELLASPSTNCLPNDDENWNLVHLAFQQWCAVPMPAPPVPQRLQHAPYKIEPLMLFQPPRGGLLGDAPPSFSYVGGGGGGVSQFCPFRGCQWIGSGREELYQHFVEHSDKFKSAGAAATCIKSIPVELLLDKSQPDWKSISKYITPHLLPRVPKSPRNLRPQPEPLFPKVPAVDAQKAPQFCLLPDCTWNGVGRPALVTHCQSHKERFASPSMMMKCLIAIPVSLLVKSGLRGADVDKYLRQYLRPTESHTPAVMTNIASLNRATTAEPNVTTAESGSSATAKDVEQFCPLAGCSWIGSGRPDLLRHFISYAHKEAFDSNNCARRCLQGIPFELLTNKAEVDWEELNEKILPHIKTSFKARQIAAKASAPARPQASRVAANNSTIKSEPKPSPTKSTSTVSATTAAQHCPMKGCSWKGKGRPGVLSHCRGMHVDFFGTAGAAMKCLAEIPVSTLADAATMDKNKIEEKMRTILNMSTPTKTAVKEDVKPAGSKVAEQKPAEVEPSQVVSTDGHTLFCPWVLCTWTGNSMSEVINHCSSSHLDIFKTESGMKKAVSALSVAALQDRGNTNWLHLEKVLRPHLKKFVPRPLQEASMAPQFCPIQTCTWYGNGRPAVIKHCETHKDYFQTPSQVMKCLISIPISMLVSRPIADWSEINKQLEASTGIKSSRSAGSVAKSANTSQSPKSNVKSAFQYCPFRSCSWTGTGRPELFKHCSAVHSDEFLSFMELRNCLSNLPVAMLESRPDCNAIDAMMKPHLKPVEKKAAEKKTVAKQPEKTGNGQFCPIRSCGWEGEGRLDLLAHCAAHKDDVTAVNFLRKCVEKMPLSLLTNREFADWMEINKEIKKCMKRTRLAKLKKDPTEFSTATSSQFCPFRICDWVGKGRPALLKHCSVKHGEYFVSSVETRRCLSAIPISLLADRSKADWDVIETHLSPYNQDNISSDGDAKMSASPTSINNGASPGNDEDFEQKNRDALEREALMSSRENCKQQ